MNNKRKLKKGVAILWVLFLLLSLVLFAEMLWGYYITNTLLQRRYENSIQVFYELEAAKTACSWEEDHANIAMNWDTTKTTESKLKGATIDNQGLYRLEGFNFLAQALSNTGIVTIYAHGFKGAQTDPQYSDYLEYIYTANTPFYKFVLFKNTDLNFPLASYNSLIHCNGGKIHTNENIYFSGQGIRFDQLRELSATGKIQYTQIDKYPAPHDIDNLDEKNDGMAPAPSLTNEDYHFYTTTGKNVLPGPDKYWYLNSKTGLYSLEWKTYADKLAGEWSPIAMAWKGEESFFYGRQYIDMGDTSRGYYLKKDGNYSTTPLPPGEAATIKRIYLSGLTGDYLITKETTGQKDYYLDDVYFRPHQNDQGALNEKWFEIPGALPQTYTWDKYYSLSSTEKPVTFYATEDCTKGSSGCNFSSNPYDPKYDKGWRYIKTRGKKICEDDLCYSASDSNYIKAQNYTVSDETLYYNYLNPYIYDKNSEFFLDYTYGDDWGESDSLYRLIRTFDTQKQPEGFKSYQGELTKENMEKVILTAAERKEMSLLGGLFDELDDKGKVKKNSTYKIKAQESGLYIDCDNVDTVITDLNSGDIEVAKKVTFFNWKTNKPITLIDIDVGKMNEQNKAPANGMVYAKCIPIRLSNAKDLPGDNLADGRKAVFTVISEESVYLKGNYNYNPADSQDTNQQWQISNVATKKIIYTLSDVFDDPQAAPDLAIYKDYPYVYVKKEGGKFIEKEGDPKLGNGTWLQGNEYGISSDVKKWITNTVKQKQKDYEKSAIEPPNSVNKASYNYNSVFITPYDIDDSLENWYYKDEGKNKQATKYITGSMLNLYADNPEYPEYLNYYAALGPEEGTWDYRSSTGGLTLNASYIQDSGARLGGSQPYRYLEYDKRFPTANISNPDAALGVVGSDNKIVIVWRLVSKNYFDGHIK